MLTHKYQKYAHNYVAKNNLVAHSCIKQTTELDVLRVSDYNKQSQLQPVSVVSHNCFPGASDPIPNLAHNIHIRDLQKCNKITFFLLLEISGEVCHSRM